ncbi:formate dehydrogenase subunit delta [Sphaerotilus mobilis]|uniref:Formate dehydrogenase subunit delta n=2 Tax=Sphaerotilus mobilis TaxID=47994 RepID=A0A4Q7LTT9_9BURK|nr:formate dehydrogenase subunit delta [Sphaerotilus mobilis]
MSRAPFDAPDASDEAADAGHAHDFHAGVLDNLIRMANRIGQFFEIYPDREEAIDGVALHIRKFWEPRMRRQLYAHLDGPAQGAGLSALLIETAQARRGELLPKG